MICKKCNTNNDDSSHFCTNCGAPLNNNEALMNAKKQKMFTGHLLNIFSVIIPIVLMIVFSLPTDSSNESSEGVTIVFNANPSASLLFFIVIVGFIIFLLGLFIYFCKRNKIKLIASYVYLTASIIDLLLLFAVCATYIIATCGIGVILFVPGILQIKAGINFISATKY